MKYILALNCGSSSVKYALFHCNKEEKEIVRGTIERVKSHKKAIEQQTLSELQ